MEKNRPRFTRFFDDVARENRKRDRLTRAEIFVFFKSRANIEVMALTVVSKRRFRSRS
jgi:hypothetical protein